MNLNNFNIKFISLNDWVYLSRHYSLFFRKGFEQFPHDDIDKAIDVVLILNDDGLKLEENQKNNILSKNFYELDDIEKSFLDFEKSRVYFPKFFWQYCYLKFLSDGILDKYITKTDLENFYNALKNPDCKIQNFETTMVARPEQKPLFDLVNKYATQRPEALKGIIKAAPGFGKEQPYTEPVLTPNGWVTMGSLKINDYVMGADGKPTKVLNIFEQGKKDVYKITFNDGTWTRCGIDHLWRIYHRYGKKWEVKSLREIKDNYLGRYIYKDKRYKNSKQLDRRYAVQLNEPIDFIEKPLPIHPYSLGLLLGDGSFRNNQISYTDKFGTTIDKLIKYLKIDFPDIQISPFSENNNSYLIESQTLKKVLKELNLFGKLSIDKFIPDIYKYNSIKNRELLIQGLIDTDSWKDKKNKKIHLVTSSKLLKIDICDLLHSFGYTVRCNITKKPSYNYNEIKMYSQNEAYDIHFNKNKNKKFIERIEKLDYQEESRCIMVDNKDHLYITRDFTVTHNTASSLKIVNDLKVRTLIILPNDILLKQWQQSIYKFSNFKEEDIGILNGSNLDQLKKEIKKEIGLVIINSIYSQINRYGYEEIFDLYKDVGLVFIDEAHTSGGAESFSKCTKVFKTNNILGLTATPFRNGVNDFLLYHSVGSIFWESDHQNLIPTINIHNCHLVFNTKVMNTLQYFKNDYIKFLVTYNNALAENEVYFNYIAQWVDYRVKEGHKVIVIFSLNKMIIKLDKLLRQAYGIDSGIIIGDTKKESKKEKEKLSEKNIKQIEEVYFKIYPKRKKIPDLNIGMVVTSKIKLLLDECNIYRKENNLEPIILEEIIQEDPELTIARNKKVIIGNPQMLKAGFDEDSASCLIIGTPLVGKVATIQMVGRITRINPNKIQKVQAHFMWGTIFENYFNDMHWTLIRNLKVGFPDAKFNLEGFKK